MLLVNKIFSHKIEKECCANTNIEEIQFTICLKCNYLKDYGKHFCECDYKQIKGGT